MRGQAIIVLLALAFSIVPAAPLAPAPASGGRPLLGTLNICHSSAPALSSTGQAPCMIAPLFHEEPALLLLPSERTEPAVTASMFSTICWHPPRA